LPHTYNRHWRGSLLFEVNGINFLSLVNEARGADGRRPTRTVIEGQSGLRLARESLGSPKFVRHEGRTAEAIHSAEPKAPAEKSNPIENTRTNAVVFREYLQEQLLRVAGGVGSVFVHDDLTNPSKVSKTHIDKNEYQNFLLRRFQFAPVLGLNRTCIREPNFITVLSLRRIHRNCPSYVRMGLIVLLTNLSQPSGQNPQRMNRIQSRAFGRIP
jgi:hypothetical protein